LGLQNPRKKDRKMAQMPRADTGDSVGRFRRDWCSTLFNYHSNLFMCGTFLQKSIHLLDNRRLLATPNEIYDLNLSAVTLSIWSFRTPTSIFCTEELYNPGFFCSASNPLDPGVAEKTGEWKKLENLIQNRFEGIVGARHTAAPRIGRRDHVGRIMTI